MPNDIPGLERSLHATNTWIKHVAAKMNVPRQHGYHALRAVLHTVRDRLPPDEAAHLSAQLPMLLRGIYYEGYAPSRTPLKLRDRSSFIAHIDEMLELPLNSEDALKAVFEVMGEQIDRGELEDVRDMLPREIRDLLTPTAPA